MVVCFVFVEKLLLQMISSNKDAQRKTILQLYDCLKKITAHEPRAMAQYLVRDPRLSTRNLAIKLTKNVTKVSHMPISRHLARLGYQNSLPLKTAMLAVAHREARVSWATRHLNDNWENTLFSDETAFQLFRNTITQWYKG